MYYKRTQITQSTIRYLQVSLPVVARAHAINEDIEGPKRLLLRHVSVRWYVVLGNT